MALLLAKHGLHMFLDIGSSWISINVSRGVTCQISYCWVYPEAPFHRNGQNMALFWPEHGLHMVLKIGSSWILINVPRDIPCNISHCLVYSVAPFPRNGQNMAFLLPIMVLAWSFKLALSESYLMFPGMLHAKFQSRSIHTDRYFQLCDSLTQVISDSPKV